jgi:hypothetical protein
LSTFAMQSALKLKLKVSRQFEVGLLLCSRSPTER